MGFYWYLVEFSFKTCLECFIYHYNEEKQQAKKEENLISYWYQFMAVTTLGYTFIRCDMIYISKNNKTITRMISSKVQMSLTFLFCD